MANKEHLGILKQGVEAWNKWRHENPSTEPDLSGADLNETKLGGADFGWANLSGANLTAADLLEADLTGAELGIADLSGAYLIEANLSRAHLTGANLSRARLFGAHLIGADLSGTNLSGTNLSGTNLSRAHLTAANLIAANLVGATVGATDFGNVDLSAVKGLETIQHVGPSTIGVDTIYKSKGKIPEAFLRGCGVPDTMIAYIASLVGQPIQYYSCFISYSSKDQECAERLHADLQDRGVRCWFAPEDLKIGDKFRTRIDEAIRVHDKLLLILSEPSIDSDWVEKEVEAAFEKERQQKRTVLFPVRLDDAVMKTDRAWAADIRRTRHIGDFSRCKDHDAYQKTFDRLLRDLKAESQEP